MLTVIGGNMEQQKPLFIYDCDGTLQSPAMFSWALTKKLGLTNLSFQEYKQQVGI